MIQAIWNSWTSGDYMDMKCDKQFLRTKTMLFTEERGRGGGGVGGGRVVDGRYGRRNAVMIWY